MKQTEEKNPWTTLQQRVAYESPWIRVHHHDVLNPAGNPGTYSVVHFKKLAIGIIPLDQDMNTWIVGQYRYPIGAYSWEIPEGGGDMGIDPLVSAQRELLEEAGIVATNWQLIQRMHLSNSATDELALIYVATGLKFTGAQPDEDEQLAIRKIHFDELYDQVVKGEMLDSLTVAGVLRLKLMLQEHSITL